MFNPYYPNYKNYTQNYQNCAQNLERGIVRVNGVQGANSSVALFDANEDFFTSRPRTAQATRRSAADVAATISKPCC